jgi:hypothetical protein
MKVNANFVFLRHGFACHNAVGSLHRADAFLRKSVSWKLLDILSDPELTELGVDASIHNGCVLFRNVLDNAPQLSGNPNMNFESTHVIGCSPLIRSMETAYYMLKQWNLPHYSIFPMPYLRELDETSKNKYSSSSRAKLNSEPSYAMKSIKEQKAYLQSKGILEYFDFRFVEDNLKARDEPGDIPKFVDWFTDTVIPAIDYGSGVCNTFIVTHAGVLKDFAHEGFVNNSGFALNTTIEAPPVEAKPKTKWATFSKTVKKFWKKNIKYNQTWIIQNHLPKSFFADYGKFDTPSHYCPSGRCGNLCNLMKTKSSQLEHINTQCE